MTIEVKSGDDLVFTSTAKDENGAVLDITGATINFKLAVIGTKKQIFTKAGTITGALSGDYEVVLTDEESDDFSGRYEFEIELIDAALNKSTIASGFITFEAKIS